jgi:PAS domain S-box-containing protein
MTDDHNDSRPELVALRRRAEARNRRHPMGERDLATLTPAEIQALVHDLDVHRIELEMQNDDLQRAQMELEASRDRYSSLFELAPVGYLSLDSKGRILQANRTAADLLGVQQRLLETRRLQELVVPEDQDTLFMHLRQGFQGPARWRCELRMQSADRQPFVAQLEGAGQPDAQGRISQCLAVIVDITDRKAAETELREANRRKDELLAMLAHELRNPLAPIRNASELLGVLDVSEPRVKWAQGIIQRQVEHLSRLVDDLLDVSRIVRGKIELRCEPVELTFLVDQAAACIRTSLAAKGQGLQLQLPAQPVAVHGDPVRLAQVLVNLLDNAAKYSPEGASIELEAQAQGEQVAILVRDHGIGIPAELLPRVFDLFQQGERTPSRPQGGLGIGLTLVQRLVILHGGTVEVHSAGPDTGTTVTLHLPAAQLPAAPRQADGAPLATPSQPMSVLVVDDERDVAHSTALVLQSAGHQVQTCHSGEEALEQVLVFRPQVVLLDIALGGIDGYQTASALRQLPGGEALLLVAVTGYGDDKARLRSREVGFDHHLVKPVSFQDLCRVLSVAAVARPATQTGNRAPSSPDTDPAAA